MEVGPTSATHGQSAMDILGAMHRAAVIPESPCESENKKLRGGNRVGRIPSLPGVE